MALKGIFAMVACAASLAAGPVLADDYRPEEFLTLDLAKAVFSPRPLGPPAQFEQMRVEAKTDAQSNAVQVEAVPKATGKIRMTHARAETRIAPARADKPRAAPARTRLAHRHSNPLDAQASDTRIQVWPCRSGGICNWQRPARGE